MTTVITTDGLSPDDSTAFWHDAGSRVLGLRDIRPVHEGPIRGNVEANWLGQMLLARLSASGHEIRRTSTHVKDAVELFQFALVDRGSARLEQDDRQVELAPGDCVIYETNRPFIWTFADSWEVSLFGFPGPSVPLPQSQRPQLTARRLEADAALTGVTSRFLQDLARQSPELPSTAAEPTSATALDLMLTLLAEQLSDGKAGDGAAQRSLMLRIRGYVERHHRDPSLGPQQIAAAANISTRYLHKLFAADALSVSRYLREMRLNAVHSDLEDPALAGHAIAEIAYDRGFGDISGFNRAFRDAYGLTPTDVRAQTAAIGREAIAR